MIKVIITDVDGVLTDGGFYYGNEGLAFKKFNTRDAAAVLRAKAHGISVYIVTASDDIITRLRIEQMDVPYALFGRTDKLAAVKEICTDLECCELNEVAYIGDDVMDVPALKAVGTSFCPADAALACLKIGRVCDRKGGEGVLAEVIDKILEDNRCLIGFLKQINEKTMSL